MLATDIWFENINKEKYEQILLEKDPNYDLRVYETFMIITISNAIGGEMQQVQTEIRGIPYVTVVRTVGLSKNLGQRTIAKISIRFAMLGNKSRNKFRDKILIPKMMTIKGLQIHKVFPVRRTNIQGTIRNVSREAGNNKISSFNVVEEGNLDFSHMPRRSSYTMVTPKQTIEQVISGWVDNSKEYSEAPVNVNNMRYHVMYNWKDLVPYMKSKRFDGDKESFNNMYQDFIASGVSSPVLVSIYKDGTAQVVGNEDVIFFARKSGLEEIPVFFNFQETNNDIKTDF